MVIASNISSSKIELVGMVNLSFAEFERSLSCHSGIFSNAMLTWLRSIFDNDVTRSLLVGFLFMGTALLPIWPFLKGSATSPISVLWRFRISTAIFSNVAPIKALQNTYSAYFSRAMICVVTSAGYKESFFAILFWISSAFEPIREPVPTTPKVLHTSTLFLHSSILSTWFDISEAQFANFKPNAMILACWPCVLPTAGTFLNFIASFAKMIPNFATFGSIILNESLTCIELPVSTRSLLVRP